MGWRLLERATCRPEWQIVAGLAQLFLLGLWLLAVARRLSRTTPHQ